MRMLGWLMQQVLPGAFGKILWIGIVLANYICGLACVTSSSRMAYAFARDGGLPFSFLLRRVSPKWRTPVPAIWAVAGLVILSTLYAPAYSTLTTSSVIFLYVSYAMPSAAGFFAYGKTWTKMGPFDLGQGLFKLLAVLSVLGVLVLIWIGVQPPNEKALPVTLILWACWWQCGGRGFEGFFKALLCYRRHRPRLREPLVRVGCRDSCLRDAELVKPLAANRLNWIPSHVDCLAPVPTV